MSGLDTRGLASGFAQGFGLMNQYQRGQRADERADQQLAMQERGLQMREQEFDALQEARQLEQDKEFASSWLQRAAAASEMQNPDMFPAWDEQAQEVFGRVPMMSPAHLFKNETIDATRYAEQLQQGGGQMFSDTTAKHMNNFFQPRIDRMPGRRSRVAKIYPGQQEGTLTFELGVTPTGGLNDVEQQEYMAPMTRNRGVAGEDDEIMQTPLDDVIRPVLGARKIYEAFGENLPYMQRIGVMQGWLPEPADSYETIQGPGGSILQRNTVTGETEQVLGRAPSAAGGQGAPTATMKEAQWMVDQGIAADIPSAFETLRRSRGDDLQRDRLQLQTLNSDLDRIARRLSNMRPNHDGYAELSAQYDSLVEQRNAIAGQVFESGGGTNQQAQAPQEGEAPTAAAMADDELLNSILRDL